MEVEKNQQERSRSEKRRSEPPSQPQNKSESKNTYARKGKGNPEAKSRWDNLRRAGQK